MLLPSDATTRTSDGDARSAAKSAHDAIAKSNDLCCRQITIRRCSWDDTAKLIEEHRDLYDLEGLQGRKAALQRMSVEERKNWDSTTTRNGENWGARAQLGRAFI